MTLTEEAGVPTNVVDIARQIYDKIMSTIKPNIDLEDFLDNEIILKGNFQINNFNFSKINLEFNVNNFDGYNVKDKNILILGMAHRGTVELAKNFNYTVTNDPDRVNLFINLAVRDTTTTTTQELIDVFKDERVVMVSSLAHELKHAYDESVYKKVGTPGRVDYSIGSERSFGNIQPINEFIRFMYFAHTVENLVRPTELYATLDEMGVSREEFYKFITSNRVYQTYKKGSQFTYEYLREELSKVIPEIKETFDDNNIDYPKNISDEDMVDFTLMEFYDTLKNWKSGIMDRMLTTDFMETFMGFQGKKKEYFEKYLKRLNKFDDDYEGFFRYETKQINNICLKMTKKISKIFSLIKDKNPQD